MGSGITWKVKRNSRSRPTARLSQQKHSCRLENILLFLATLAPSVRGIEETKVMRFKEDLAPNQPAQLQDTSSERWVAVQSFLGL